MNILMSCNSNYFLPTLVTMHSILVNNPCNIMFYILHSSLTDEQLERMKFLAEEGGHGSVVSVPVSPENFQGKNSGLSYLSQEAYYRLLAQKLLPISVTRYLWLDSDVVVTGNIEDFYNQDMEGNLLVACSIMKEGTVSENLNRVTLPKDTRYFNSGVYLADLESQRRVLDPDVYENYLRIFEKRFLFADQDVLNAVFYRCVKYADVYIYNMKPQYLEAMTQEQRMECLRNCRILHYNGGGMKPWRGDYPGLWSRIWWDYAETLPEYAGMYEKLRPEQEQAREKFLCHLSKKLAEKTKAYM